MIDAILIGCLLLLVFFGPEWTRGLSGVED